MRRDSSGQISLIITAVCQVHAPLFCLCWGPLGWLVLSRKMPSVKVLAPRGVCHHRPFSYLELASPAQCLPVATSLALGHEHTYTPHISVDASALNWE